MHSMTHAHGHTYKYKTIKALYLRLVIIVY